jgi:endoglucanase
MRRAIAVILLALTTLGARASCWPEWDAFRDRFITPDGRVVEHGTQDLRTTSEGQSYALFFALVANDRDTFDRILGWTEEHLAEGDLTVNLPAWLWGKSGDEWGVLRRKSAMDADLWLAYTLGEADRRWHQERYATLAQALARHILDAESADLPGLGLIPLPAPSGFHPSAGRARLNPSYVPIQLARRMAALYPEWNGIAERWSEVIQGSAPAGIVPDWVWYDEDKGFTADKATKGVGSFDAIRVYLWAGMLDPADPLRAELLKLMMPMAKAVVTQGSPPVGADSRNGAYGGASPPAFTSAMLPFLQAAGMTEVLEKQRQRLNDAHLEWSYNYYDRALTLFGLGWLEGRFRFALDGTLIAACAS